MDGRTREIRWVPTHERIPFEVADHSMHPIGPHHCKCACSDVVEFSCPEHGRAVAAREYRYTTPWRPLPAVVGVVAVQAEEEK